MNLLVVFTDFGIGSPYVGQLKNALLPYAPTVPVIDLCHDLPPFDSQAAAYLLAAYIQDFPAGSVIVGVVDPGVGSDRLGLIVHADDKFYVGPDNGLFNPVAARAERLRVWQIIWRPARLTATFHGRDIFAPVAAMLAAGTASPDELGDPLDFAVREWPDDLARVVYIDRYGNAITGIRAASLGTAEIAIPGLVQRLPRARTFADVAPGAGFWYENSSGLAELAINQGTAAVTYALTPGQVVDVIGTPLTAIRAR